MLTPLNSCTHKHLKTDSSRREQKSCYCNTHAMQSQTSRSQVSLHPFFMTIPINEMECHIQLVFMSVAILVSNSI